MIAPWLFLALMIYAMFIVAEKFTAILYSQRRNLASTVPPPLPSLNPSTSVDVGK
jgi:hypothetical protein